MQDGVCNRDGEFELIVEAAAELDRRWMDHLQRPKSAIPWHDVRRRLLERERGDSTAGERLPDDVPEIP